MSERGQEEGNGTGRRRGKEEREEERCAYNTYSILENVELIKNDSSRL